MNNYKFKKSQILMLSLLAALLTITPLLSSSSRRTYLYFVINLLIIALGAEAGLLSSAFSKPQEDKKYSGKPLPATQEASTEATRVITSSTTPSSEQKKLVKTVEKSASEKISTAVKVKKCPSMPSLFFIGSGEIEAAEEPLPLAKEYLYGEEEEKFVDGLSGQELFTKAEMFIGNFYKQLKMQREESWKKIHGFYQKAF